MKYFAFVLVLILTTTTHGGSCNDCGQWSGLIAQLKRAQSEKSKHRVAEQIFDQVGSFTPNQKSLSLQVTLMLKLMNEVAPYDPYDIVGLTVYNRYLLNPDLFEKNLKGRVKAKFLKVMQKREDGFGGESRSLDLSK